MEALLADDVTLVLLSTYGGKHADPSSNRSVALETRFSDGGVHVGRRWLSIHAYGPLEPLSQAAGKWLT